jgi:hypothetical protein
MLKKYDGAVMKAVALCIKAYLKPEEAMIYTNLSRTRLASKCRDIGISKNENGYFKREDLDLIMSGAPKVEQKTNEIILGKRRNSKD